MLHACQSFELYTFSSFREIRTNRLLSRITDQQLHHFWHQCGVQKVKKRQFPTEVPNHYLHRILLSTTYCHFGLHCYIDSHFFAHFGNFQIVYLTSNIQISVKKQQKCKTNVLKNLS